MSMIRIMIRSTIRSRSMIRIMIRSTIRSRSMIRNNACNSVVCSVVIYYKIRLFISIYYRSSILTS